MFTHFEASVITWSLAVIAIIMALTWLAGSPWRRPPT